MFEERKKIFDEITRKAAKRMTNEYDFSKFEDTLDFFFAMEAFKQILAFDIYKVGNDLENYDDKRIEFLSLVAMICGHDLMDIVPVTLRCFTKEREKWIIETLKADRLIPFSEKKEV